MILSYPETAERGHERTLGEDARQQREDTRDIKRGHERTERGSEVTLREDSQLTLREDTREHWERTVSFEV